MPDQKYTQIREYSLSDAPGKDYYRIRVKIESATNHSPEGMVSNFLHDYVIEGDKVELSSPAGIFTLNKKSDRSVVLISGGVGVTPLMSMLNYLMETKSDRQVTFIQAAANSKVHAFRDHVDELSQNNTNFRAFFIYSQPTDEDREKENYHMEGFFTLDWLQTILPDSQADFYFCGPIPFMKAVYGALKQWGVSEEQIHYEFFGPSGTLEVEVDFEPALELDREMEHVKQ
ncbi:Ferredoxin-NADP reductase [Seinonella peptonophila]|uniref:nitric oxide dioxygenase n=1 Tax=Seinonella peptonophila TaxID=112248 RepID=A0A1M4SXK6_9BACL|nr:Ferredoxin-NADP reductase [Seinonella peptonophila]